LTENIQFFNAKYFMFSYSYPWFQCLEKRAYFYDHVFLQSILLPDKNKIEMSLNLIYKSEKVFFLYNLVGIILFPCTKIKQRL